MKLIAPSILSADFAHLGDDVRKVIEAGADWIHADVMDGHFVPNITFGPMVVAALRRITDLPIDVHLMIEAPERYISDFAAAGASHISVQVETCPHLHRTVHQIRENGARPGVVLNPATPLAAISWILSDVDYVLVMSVNPGFGSQRFIETSTSKLRRVRHLQEELNPLSELEVDGGIWANNIDDVVRSGANVIVAGTAVFNSTASVEENIAALRQSAKRASWRTV